MKLYGHPVSGNTHKVKLLLAELKLDYEDIVVDLMQGAHKAPEFLSMNPIGQVPVLVDGNITIRDSHAILVYLTHKHQRADLLPTDSRDLALVHQWLSFSANEIQHGPFLARLHFLLNVPMDLAAMQEQARNTLKIMDDHLATRQWLELDHMTVADIACFPYIALVGEGKVELADFKHVVAWINRIKALPNFVTMAGM